MAAALVSKIISPRPIVVIFGATGTGKSKLAVEIAKKFNGEVISVDSIQVYTGLNIVTNKVTAEEQSNVPHHLLNFVKPHVGITVLDFRDKALKIIKEIEERDKMVVLVGGTMYYIEALLFEVLLSEPLDEDELAYKYDAGFDEGKPNHLEQMSDEDLHRLATEVDPEMAKFLHPMDRRRLLRCVNVFEKTGRTLSSQLKRQRSQSGGSNYGGPLRFPSAILLWIQCEKDVLDKRLNNRVDKMLQDGLIEELREFHREYNRIRLEKNEKPDYTKGIFQAIGFKEFHQYLMLDEEKRNSPEGQKLFQECVENMKLVTRRYARRQIKWIKNRLLGRNRGEMPPTYTLDATDVSQWEEKVTRVAYDIVESISNGRKPSCEPHPESRSDLDLRVYKCEQCNIYLKGKNQYDVHTSGNKHRKVAQRIERAREAKSEEDNSGQSVRDSSDSC